MTPKETLKLFDEKFARLQSSNLLRFITSPGWKFSFNFISNSPGSDSVQPDLEIVESYVTNLRFFIQDNEEISIHNLSKFYEAHCQDTKSIDKFNELRNILNSELDRVWPFIFNGETLTFRNIFEGFIYSRIAHTNVKRHRIFHEMTERPFGYYLAYDYFLRCISLVHNVLTMISDLNKVAFPICVENK